MLVSRGKRGRSGAVASQRGIQGPVLSNPDPDARAAELTPVLKDGLCLWL